MICVQILHKKLFDMDLLSDLALTYLKSGFYFQRYLIENGLNKQSVEHVLVLVADKYLRKDPTQEEDDGVTDVGHVEAGGLGIPDWRLVL